MLRMLPFGKYKGQQLKNVFDIDKRYIEWLITTPWYNERFQMLARESKNLIDNYNMNIVLEDDITIYTDGACPFNGMEGATCGIGIHFSETNRNKLNDVSQLLDVEKPTNNFAELFAIDKAIQIIIDKELTNNKIHLYTDSKYSIDCITRWYEKWVECNKLDRPNIDIIASIYNNIQGLDIDFHHVFGHTKNNDRHSIGNDRADNLARKSVYEHLNQPKKIPNGQL